MKILKNNFTKLFNIKLLQKRKITNINSNNNLQFNIYYINNKFNSTNYSELTKNNNKYTNKNKNKNQDEDEVYKETRYEEDKIKVSNYLPYSLRQICNKLNLNITNNKLIYNIKFNKNNVNLIFNKNLYEVYPSIINSLNIKDNYNKNSLSLIIVIKDIADINKFLNINNKLGIDTSFIEPLPSSKGSLIDVHNKKQLIFDELSNLEALIVFYDQLYVNFQIIKNYFSKNVIFYCFNISKHTIDRLLIDIKPESFNDYMFYMHCFGDAKDHSIELTKLIDLENELSNYRYTHSVSYLYFLKVYFSFYIKLLKICRI